MPLVLRVWPRKKKVVVIASWGRCAFALCLGVRVALAVPTSGVQFLWTPPARATPSTNLMDFSLRGFTCHKKNCN